MKTEDKAKIADELSFEKAVERLEAIVETMESGGAGLDAMVASFEEGQKLVKFCSAKLAEIERKVEILTKGANGKAKAEPFDENLG
jgi:exodeoxyribonuclease VII small subunit